MCFILSDLKCYGSASSSSGNHFWSAKEKEWWKNNKKKQKLFNLQIMFFILLFVFHVSELSYFLFIHDNLKCYLSATWSSKSHVWTQITAEQHTSNCLGVQELVFVVFDGLIFLSSWPPLLWGVVTFSFILTIIFVSDVPRAGVQVCLDNKINGALPLYPGCLECLSVRWLTNLPYVCGSQRVKFSHLCAFNISPGWQGKHVICMPYKNLSSMDSPLFTPPLWATSDPVTNFCHFCVK